MEELLATLSSLKDYIIEPDIAKIMVALRDVQLCHELSFYEVILKDDALKVIQALQNECRSCCCGNIIEEACGVLNGLHKWKINQVRRT
jgi:hypothetical protein